MSSSKITTKLTVSDESQDFPLLVAFPQGVPENFEDMVITVGKKQSKTPKTEIITTVNGMTFKGSDFGESSVKKDGFKYAVGVLDSKSNQMKLYGTDHVFVLRPYISLDEAVVRKSTMTYSERKQSLTEKFGSQKKKRAAAAAQSNIISAENISGATALEDTLTVKPEANSELIKAAQQTLNRNRNKRGRG